MIRLSLRATVLATFALLLISSVLQGALSLATTARSAQQLTALEKHGLAPVVALSSLSQDLDQQRALLETDRAGGTADQARAVIDELQGLDMSIARTADQNLLPSILPAWRAAWAAYIRARAPYMGLLRGGPRSGLGPSARLQLSDRLDVVSDLVQSDAGAELYTGENLYIQALASDWRSLQAVVLGSLLTLVLGLLLATRISRRITHGLGNLSSTATLVAGGTVAARADERGGDEIARLAVAINVMKDALLSAELRAGTDALTGLPNHRSMVSALDREIERARRYSRPCAVLFLDIDHFKALNDGYGHAAGDAALCTFAQVVGASLRSVDSLGRWGGEEFVALLPENHSTAAQMAAEHVRAAVAAHPFPVGGGVHLTCSIGVAVYPDDARECNALVAAADHAMYAAKHLGRNQVRAATDPMVAAMRPDPGGVASREETFLVGTIEALAALVDARDHYTGQHAEEVANLALHLGQALGLSAGEAQMIGRAARLHDVGKVAIPDALLQKPGRLSEDEWVLMRTHPIVGADVVGRVPTLRAIAPLIRAHHERWDGTGYPDGLRGQAIPLGARIIAVADAFSAMTSARPYREPRDVAEALEELRRAAATHFDPAVVDALGRTLRAPVEAT